MAMHFTWVGWSMDERKPSTMEVVLEGFGGGDVGWGVEGWLGDEAVSQFVLRDKLMNRAAVMTESCTFFPACFKFAWWQIWSAWAVDMLPRHRSSHSWSKAGLLKIDIGEVLETISDPKIPADRELWGGLAPGSPGGTSWQAARYFLSDRMLA